MSTSRPLLFPYTRALDDPPQLGGAIRYGYPTPCYALAWVCPISTYMNLVTEGELHNVSDTIVRRWFAKNKFTRSQRPAVYFGPDGTYYLIAMFNSRSFPNFAERARDPNDELIVAAREALFVSPELEPTLQWYRYPMRWAKYNPDEGL